MNSKTTDSPSPALHAPMLRRSRTPQSSVQEKFALVSPPGRSAPRRGFRCRPFRCDREGELANSSRSLPSTVPGTTYEGGSPEKKVVPHEMPARHGVNTTTLSEIACTFDVGHATMLVLHQGHSTSSSSHSEEEVSSLQFIVRKP